MADFLIGIHAALGEFGIFAFLWALVELINPTKERIRRAKIAASAGVLLFFAAWLAGGYYYVVSYGSLVKPLIKAGPLPWAHLVFTEAKEHIFLFLPFLSVFALSLIQTSQRELIKNSKIRASVLMLCAVIIVLGLAMAGMGYLISTGARGALEALQ